MESRTTAGISVVAMVLVALAPCAYAKTIFIANNGADSSTCGPTGHAPCRSITQGIHNAANGDLIIVGPGKYGDLNGNGVLGEPGEETPAANCFCMLAVNKSVTIVSSDGAAATVIDARTVDVFNNVVFTANGAVFGRAGLGFTVTETKAATTNCFGIDLSNARGVTVEGNLVVSSHPCPGGGISAAGSNPGRGLIQDNQVVGWDTGINVGPNIVNRNAVQLNGLGINGFGAAVTGNFVTGNQTGIEANNSKSSVTGNAVVGNGIGILESSFDGTIPKVESNNIFGNSSCGANFADANVVATNNYWGRATGPLPPGDVCGSGASTAIVKPFATKPFSITAPVNP
jgi:hypothetical protein